MFDWFMLFLMIAACWGAEWAADDAQPVSLRTAGVWSLCYVLAAATFAGYIWLGRGAADAQLFITAYVLEKALSVDNLIVFGTVFAYFGIRPEHRRRILHWGILGAIVLRLLFVLIGVGAFHLTNRLTSIVFAGFIFYSVFQMMKGAEKEEIDHYERWYARWLEKFFPFHAGPFHHGKFLMQVYRMMDGINYWAATPALVCLIAIEVTDVMFSFDSVPTVIAVARDPFVIFSAMIFAVMGLRMLYFVVDALQRAFRYMTLSVGVILCYVAFKLLCDAFNIVHFEPLTNLLVVGVMLAGGIGLSVLMPPKEVA